MKISTFELIFSVRNKGNVDSSYELVVRTNLGEQLLVASGDLAPAATKPSKCTVHGTYKEKISGDVDQQERSERLSSV
jgi:hypothetical protein